MSRIVIGVDFTSAPSPKKPITLALGEWIPTRPLDRYRLDEVRELPSFAAFEDFLAEPGCWIGGFDLPFGQPRSLVEHEGWPTRWPQLVRDYCRRPRDELRNVFKRWCDRRPVGNKFAWRKTDRPAGSSPAMRWTNPPVAWMMHAGIGRMLAAGLVFPAHRHPAARCRHGRRGHARLKVALEAYPGFTARQVCRDSYKSDTPAAQTPARRHARRRIVAALHEGSAGLAVRLEASPRWQRRLMADGQGDLLDAVICSLQAAHAAGLPGYGLPTELDPLEGWIASVPQDAAIGMHASAMTADLPSRSPFRGRLH